MKITKNTKVAIEYKLSLDSGEVIDRSPDDQPLRFLYGLGQIIPGLEKQLEGMETGATAEVVVEPKDGYGEHREQLIKPFPKKSFPEDLEIKPGMVFQGMGEHGAFPIRVHEVKDDVVMGDLNHPLAGKRLHFDVKVTEVAEASKDEVAAAMAAACGSSCGSCCGGCGG